MFQFFKSPFYNFEFIRMLGSSTAQGAEIGECLEAVSSMKAESPEEWFRVWHAAAQRAERLAEQAEQQGDSEGARLALLRSSNYYRGSEFFLHITPHDPRLLNAIERSVANFRKAWSFGDYSDRVETLEIPYLEGTKLPGYLYTPHPSPNNGKPPVIILPSGFDNTQEELYFFLVHAALTRGYAVLTFEGPGQGIILRRDKLPLRPDWETVTSWKVLDFVFATKASTLDLSKIAIVGASMGAYFALRSAADPRIKACVAVDGFYDLYEVTTSRIPSWFVNLWQAGTLPDSIFNATVSLIQRMNFQSDWEIRHAMWSFGVDSAAAVVREMARYSLRESEDKLYLSRVQCPVLVTGAADSLYFPPEDNAVKIFGQLGHLDEGAKELWIAAGGAEGGFQAKVGATTVLHQRVFGWLGRNLLQHLQSAKMAPFGTLYTYEGNARCLKVLAVAKLNSLEIAIPNFNIASDHKQPSYLSKFPIGKVPGFETPSGLYLAESCAIAHYLAESGPLSTQLLGRDVEERARVQQWIHFSEGELFPFVVDMVLPRVGRLGFEESLDVRALKQIEFALEGLERHLGQIEEGQRWIATRKELSLADLTVASALYWGFKVVVDKGMQERYPRVVQWYRRVVGSEVVKEVFVQADLVEERWGVGSHTVEV
ncbi:Alpha/Beta hydrolase protein [Aspergillus venezuelensis]